MYDLVKLQSPTSSELKVKQQYGKLKTVSAQNWSTNFVLTLAGFAVAIAANILVKQVANVEIKTYFVAGIPFTFNLLYRLVLVVIILIYAGMGIFSYFDPVRREKFSRQAPFRFAMGLAITAWDILGTKLLLLPQPFFPGPAKILESFLIEGDFILQNTLYSIKLFFGRIYSGCGVWGGYGNFNRLVSKGILLGISNIKDYRCHSCRSVDALCTDAFPVSVFSSCFSYCNMRMVFHCGSYSPGHTIHPKVSVRSSSHPGGKNAIFNIPCCSASGHAPDFYRYFQCQWFCFYNFGNGRDDGPAGRIGLLHKFKQGVVCLL